MSGPRPDDGRPDSVVWGMPYRIIFISKPTGATKGEGRSSSAPLQDEISPIACVAVHAQHDSSDGSVVKAFAAIRMPSAMVR